MTEYKIQLAAKAKQDIRDIHNYITHQLKEPAIADRLLEQIDAEILKLQIMPLRHALERDEQLKLRHLRKLMIENYLVFYRVHEKTETVFIVRVLYGKRDWVNLL